MSYNFDEIIPRRGSNSMKWDEPENEDILPMWVADMDFKASPAIRAALAKRVEHGIFGYTAVPESYYESIISWFQRRHHWTIQRDWIQYTSGVVPGISVTVKALCSPGDKVIIQTPVYNCFFSSIRNNGCEIVENPLIYHDHTYSMDYEDLERKASDPKAKLLILCNPHNPAGRVWTPEELLKLNEICARNGVKVCSDEIHCELVFKPHKYTPFASLSKSCLDNSITLNSSSKSFNTAGLQIANIICNDPEIRRKIDRAININEVCDVNPFGVVALMAAYNESEEWLEALIDYLHKNYIELLKFFEEKLPKLAVTKMEGTYLVWVDCRALGLSSDQISEKLLKEGKIMISNGTSYSKKEGEGFIRINIACPRERMIDGLNRIYQVLSKI